MTQPWASLFVAGLKRIETRSWGTDYRGPLAVHATKEVNRELCYAEPFRTALAEIGFSMPGQLPTAALLGRVDLVDVLTMGLGLGEINIANDPRLTPRERAFGLYAPGRRAWMTGEARLVAARPVPFRGAQGLRNLPPEVADLLS